jgi:hypothetical protein
MTFPPAGYVPPGATGDAGAGSAPPPMNYGSGGYSGSAGYPGETDIGGSSNFFAEQERRADAAANAVQQQADQMMRAQEERMNRMMQPAVPTTQRVPVCSACRATLTEAETHGKRCPRCGAWWSYDSYHAGGGASGGASSAGSGPDLAFLNDPQHKRALYGGAAVVVVLAVLTAVIIGVIAVAMAIASASRSGRQYKEVG